jgi:ubiquinone/menaquinone biosynthesis C-methylase UbiE
MLIAARGFHTSKGKSNIFYTCADSESLPFSKESFDLVVCRIAAHHFPDVAAFVEEGARVLCKGGQFIFQDQVVPDDREAGLFVNDFERKRDPSHHLAYDRLGWLAFFENSGLKVILGQIITKQHNFVHWTQMQNCSPETTAELVEMALHSPPIARQWLQPDKFFDIDSATFCNRHLILLARKE